MEAKKKEGRYSRIYQQLEDLMQTASYPLSRMATIAALLHHKMDYFFWTGFYLLVDGELMVHAYQGPVACMHLEKGKGVCWSGVERQQTVVVPDVEQFPGHIACDERSQSEMVVPVRKQDGEIIGVLDIDSSEKASFDEGDEKWLEKIVNMIYA